MAGDWQAYGEPIETGLKAYQGGAAPSPIDELDEQHIIRHPDIREIWVSCVCGDDYQQVLTKWLTHYHKTITPRFANNKMRIGAYHSLYNVKELGIDRCLAMLSAYQDVQQALIVIDCGSAITIDIVNQHGCHQGGFIVPGYGVLKQTLGTHIDLPKQLSAYPTMTKIPYPRDTKTALQHGFAMMLTATVRTALQAILASLDTPAKLFVTGGDAAGISTAIGLTVIHKPYLVVHGLQLFAELGAGERT